MDLPRRATLCAAAVTAALTGPGVPGAPAQTSGGSYASRPAVIETVVCLRGCLGGTARVGGVVRVRGRRMAEVGTVTFLGAAGERDDVTVRARRVRARRVNARVPARALSGRVRVRNADGAPSRPSTATVRVGDGPVADARRPGVPDRDTSDRLDARLEARTVYFAGRRSAVIRYVVTAPDPVPVAAEVRRVPGGAPVARWDLGTVAPGAEQRVGWDGTAGGAVAPQGRYEFRVFSPVAGAAADGGGAPAGTGEVAASFRFLEHKFPVRGPHSFGDAGATFGAQRSGRSHQGQDVFAPCGTPLVAARGGVVVFASFHSNAGNYVVVRGEGDGVDYAYMHLRRPSRAGKGERVRTGQRLGEVGDSGNARGCHLHFELWAPPGWYEGGRPLDPLPHLRAWESASGRVTG